MKNVGIVEKIKYVMGTRERGQFKIVVADFIKKHKASAEEYILVSYLALQIGERNLSLECLNKCRHVFKSLPSQTLLRLAGLYAELGEFEQAKNLSFEQLSLVPLDNKWNHLLGTIYAQCGNKAGAKECLLLALDSPYVSGVTWYTLASIVDFKGEVELFNRLVDVEVASNLNSSDAMYLWYSKGKACMDVGDYEQAERYYLKGAKRIIPNTKYSFDENRKIIDNVINSNKHKDKIKKNATKNLSTRKIVALLGLPRSGTTLLGHILSAHSKFGTATEYNGLGHALWSIPPEERLGFPFNISDKYNTENIVREVEESYVSITDEYFPDGRYLVDKSLNLNKYFGVWANLNAEGKAIYIKRNKSDIAWSCYRTPFRERADWSWHPKTIANYISNEHELLNFWMEKYPDRILEIQYENLVSDTEVTLNNICSFLDIEFEKQMLSFHLNPQPVLTSSVGQVNRPINPDSIGVAKNFPGFIRAISNK